jgi:hypothetical protein
LAETVLSCDDSVNAVMLVDDNGRVLAHGRADGYEADEMSMKESAPMLVPVPGLRMMAFLRLSSSAARERVYGKVLGTLSFPDNFIAP